MILRSDIRKHTAHMRTFCKKFQIVLHFLLVKSFLFLFSWATLNLLWVEYRWKCPVCYLFYGTQGLDEVFGVKNICAGSR